MTQSVLWVDPDQPQDASLLLLLANEGFDLIKATRGSNALVLADASIDLVLLELDLPDADGLEICQRLRRQSSVPIILLTARNDEISKVVGLEMGADDYVTKPFSSRELVARVRAVLRRARRDPASPCVLHAGRLHLDLARGELKVGELPVELSAMQYRLLRLLMEHPGQVLDRDYLIDQVWREKFMGGAKTLAVHIRWLRQKVEADPGRPVHLVTVRGMGYRFESGQAHPGNGGQEISADMAAC